MKHKPTPLSQPLTVLLAFIFLGLFHFCLIPLFSYAIEEVQYAFATPTPTPVALPLGTDRDDDEGTARSLYYGWLREQRDLQASPDPELEDKAYYLAGEAPRLRSSNAWPQWYGLRYAVGPANGTWYRDWPGCNPCPADSVCFTLPSASRLAMATAAYPGLDEADRVGAAVAWRDGQQYLAVVWPGTCPTFAPIPTPADVGPVGPGW